MLSLEANNNRFTRYSGIISPSTLMDANCVVVGVGAIGSQVARLLTTMGVGRITLIDPDTVSPVNLGPQGFPPTHVGRHKTVSLCETLSGLADEHQQIITREREAMGSDLTGRTAVFMCVDTMSARQFLTRNLRQPTILVDTRMGAHAIRVITANSLESYGAYRETLFNDDQALQEPCTTRSTNYAAYVAAGIAVSSFVQSLRQFPVPNDVTFNLLSYDAFTGPAPAAAAELQPVSAAP